MGEVRDWFAANRPDVAFTDLPEVREAGTWPGEDISRNFSSLFYVGGILALLSAIALVSNTMTTMVAEQSREIAIMKAIGGHRRQVMGAFLRSVLIIATVGTAVGILLGIPFANFVAGFVGSHFLGVQTSFGVSWPVILLSLFVGIGGAVLASLPALFRASRISVHDGLTSGMAASGDTRLDRVLRRIPLPRTAQVGLRNISRRKTRTIGTVVQVGLAAGVALGFLALGSTISDVTAKSWDTLRWDVDVEQRSNTPLDAGADAVLANLGASGSHAMLYNMMDIGGSQYPVWGLPPDALYTPHIEAGRWLTASDIASPTPVMVVAHALAAKQSLHVGDTVTVGLATGPRQVTVIGIDSNLINNGTNAFIPLTTLQQMLGRSDTNAWWLRAPDSDHAAIDTLAATAEDQLAAAGYPVTTHVHYVEKATNISQNRMLVMVLAVMGIPIVVIGLIGLVNMMTMNVLERTREVGILRCIGARSRDITSIFRTEALAVAFLGWIVAVPAGWVIGWTLTRIVTNLFDFGSVPYTFPGWYPLMALVATIGLAALVVIAPLRRASHLRPGDALRYE